MKKIIYILLLLSTQTIWGQQESQFANTFQNPYLLNPAAGGMYGVMQIDATSRMQWAGYGQGPSTMLLSAHSMIKVRSSLSNEEYNPQGESFYSNPKVKVGGIKHVIGGRALNDAIGVFNKTSIYGSYAIHIPLTKEYMLGAGIGLGWSNFRINQSRVTLYDQDDLTYSSFLTGQGSQNIGDLNAGLVFYSNDLYVGVSTMQVLKNDVKFGPVLTGSNFNRHYFITAKYGIYNGNIGFEPNVNLKVAEQSPSSLDYGVRVLYKRASWIGVWGRGTNSLVFQVGTNLVKNLYFSYAYEQGIGQLRDAVSGTHEIQLGIYIGKNRRIEKEMDEE